MAKVTALNVGHCTHPACMALKGSGFASRCFPSRAYLIETTQGLAVWDTGYAERFRDASREGVYRLYPAVTPVTFSPEHALVAQLKNLGISHEDIGLVLLSHFHADHIAGLKDFPNAKVVCEHKGWFAVRHLTGLTALLQAFLPGLIPSDLESRLGFVQQSELIALPASLAPFTHGWDVIGTGEIVVVPLPGHAPGHIGAFVHTDEGWTLLASDSAWAKEAYAELRGPSELSFLIQDSRRDYYATLEKIHLLHGSGGARIELTHQPYEA